MGLSVTLYPHGETNGNIIFSVVRDRTHCSIKILVAAILDLEPFED
jgi:hypothetical protein